MIILLTLVATLTKNNNFPINWSSPSTSDNSNNNEIYGTTDSNVTITYKTPHGKIPWVVTVTIIKIIAWNRSINEDIMTLRPLQTQKKLCVYLKMAYSKNGF